MKPKSRLILPELQETLQFWEDIFSIALLQRKVLATGNTKTKEAILDPGDFSPIALGNYEQFPTALINKKSIDSTQFLPRVPRSDVNWLDKLAYARGSHIGTPAITMYPYMISEWLKTKKVFKLEDSNAILARKYKKQNYLNLLPCGSFIISFSEPLEIAYPKSSVIKTYKSVIVARSGDLVDTLWIPEDIGMKHAPDKTRKLLKKALKGNHVNDVYLREFLFSASLFDPVDNQPSFLNFAFHIEKPLFFYHRTQEKDTFKVKNNYLDIFHRGFFRKNLGLVEEHDGQFSSSKSSRSHPLFEDDTRFVRFLFEFLNGFCFALSEIKPKNPTVVTGGKDLHDNDLEQHLVWNEIPITKVDYLEEDRDSKTLKISYGSGEKDFHIRMGHWRNLVRKDGTSYRIWISDMEVRADKKEAGQELKGSTTVIREKHTSR